MCVNCSQDNYGNPVGVSFREMMQAMASGLSYVDYLEDNLRRMPEYKKFMSEIDQEIDGYRSKVKKSIAITDTVTLHVLDMQVSPKHVNDLVLYLQNAQRNSPAPSKVDVYFPADLDKPGGVTSRVDNNGKADTRGKNRVIGLHASLFTIKRSELRDDFMMPIGNLVSIPEYAVTHEWAHVLDTRSRLDDSIADRLTTSANADIAGSPFNASLSGYGLTDEAEAFAEAFTQWALSKGQTDNFAANWYAKEYDWPKWN